MPAMRCSTTRWRSRRSSTSTQPAEDLLALEGMDEETAFALAAHGVRTSEDLADLATDELVEFGIEGLDEDRGRGADPGRARRGNRASGTWQS